MDPIIQTHQLSVGYSSGKQVKVILKDLNLKVLRGELIGMIGENGIGKSSLLRTLVNLQHPLQGKISLYGKNITRYNRNELARTLSFVSTEPVRLQHCTVEQLVSYGRFPYTNWFGKLTRDDRTKIQEAIELVGLQHLSRRPVNEISDGERQRTMIARSLAQDTDLIILDEPTAFLDMPNKYEILHLLGELSRSSRKTIIFSSHDLPVVMKESDRLWLITPSAFLDGSPEDLVLQHGIESMLSHSKLKFDPVKAEFSIFRPPLATCSLQGEGLLSEWTTKALERIGIRKVQNHEITDIDIRIINHHQQPCWEIKFRGQMMTFTTIYDCITFLKSKIYP